MSLNYKSDMVDAKGPKRLIDESVILVVLEFDCNSERTLNKSCDERVGYFVRDKGNECSILDRERLGGWSCF